jgi:hypothetical protein
VPQIGRVSLKRTPFVQLDWIALLGNSQRQVHALLGVFVAAPTFS